MQVREKTHHIDVTLSGEGTEHIAEVIRDRFPDAEFVDDAMETERWDDTELAADIRLRKTPGKLVRAYRQRAGMTVTELAKAVGTKYPNISAMEHDRRRVGLNMARKLGKALSCDYRKFLET
jgi:DNA-binding XRE family transcriptional regulator